MFLWLLFGYLSTQVNCDLQRMLANSILVRHMISLLAFFFLFTLIDSNNKANLATTWIKTLVVYILFILTTKSKWYFIVPVLTLLMVDQSMKKYLEQVTDPKERLAFERTSKFINALIIVVIIVGALHYMTVQKAEYKDKFSLFTFFIGTTKPCKKRGFIQGVHPGGSSPYAEELRNEK
jgi:hypothetical protein